MNRSADWRLKCHLLKLICVLWMACPVAMASSNTFVPSGKLEIHYINVGQGGCTLIIGPDGTRILYDFGNASGKKFILPYLEKVVGLKPEHDFDYSIVSHRDRDHYIGYKAVVERGFDFTVANYGCGSPKPATQLISKAWLNPAKTTTAGEVRPIPVGMRFSLGQGATALVVAANGKVYELDEPRPVHNENDRSVSLYITHKDFQYILDGDLGSGPEACTFHHTSQIDVQSYVAAMLIDQKLMDERFGLDVLHIAHHGSESSTSAKYYNLVKPEVGLISVGFKQGSFRHPREDVVDRVLLDTDMRVECVTAPPLKALFQTEIGKGKDNPGEGEMDRCSSTGCTSYSGQVVGNIKLVTDGQSYEIFKNPAEGEDTQGSVFTRIWYSAVDEVSD